MIEYEPPAPTTTVETPIAVTDLKPYAYQGQQSVSPWQHTLFDGEKFPGGYGPTLLQHIDYWTLRERSSELFNNNLYARGMIRRYITNIINTGLTPEANPEDILIGMGETALANWSDDVEARHLLWAKNPQACDWMRQNTFGAIQATVKREALIDGDVLVVIRESQRTKLPTVQVIRGNRVQSPLSGDKNVPRGHEVKLGVEFDATDRVVAYWVRQKDGTSKRLAAFGPKSGRRIAWLVFGTDKRLDDIRGQPLLAIVMQSLKELDRYRDAATRKAVISSFVAMFIKKSSDKVGSLPVTGGALAHQQLDGTGVDGQPIKRNIVGQIPGMVMEDLNMGEEPVGFKSDATDTNFGIFEETLVSAMAWCFETPPEIMKLAFSSNYSASQAANNEYRLFLNKEWAGFGDQFCTPVHNAWLINQALLGKIPAAGLLRAWRDPLQQDVFTAWVNTEWYGTVKLSNDIVKTVKGSELLIKNALSTHAREARNINGSKWTTNARKVKRENQILAEAIEPMLKMQQKFGTVEVDAAISAMDTAVLSLVDAAEVVSNGS